MAGGNSSWPWRTSRPALLYGTSKNTEEQPSCAPQPAGECRDTIGIGGPRNSPLPHHRTYGSVYGRFAGSSGNSCSIDAVVWMSANVAPASTPLISASGFHPFPPFRGRLPGIQSRGRCDITASTRHFQRSGLQRNSFRLLCSLLTSALRSDRLATTSVSLPRRSADLPR
jgi:hypothetical protein